MTVTSCISDYGGVPTLFVNGEPQAGMAYITYFEDRNHYADFAAAGYRLFSFTVFAGDRPISEAQHPAPFNAAVFPEPGKEDFTPFDECVEHILAACPEAMIFPRVNLSLPSWWEEAHPDELNDSGSSQFPECRRPCFSSRKWLDQTAEFMRRIIAHVEASPWKDHIVAYQIASGGTEEWFTFDANGSQGAASRKLFAERGGDLADVAAYHQFLSDIIAENITVIAGVAKDATGHRLAIGAFYGYTLECPWWQSGHHGLRIVLDSPNVDFLCSPMSYRDCRKPGQDWYCITALDSLKLHGKAYFTELDIRTHLSKFMGQSRKGSCLPGTYEQPIWLGPKDPKVCEWILTACIGRQLTHGTNSWWFDMWGGWYDTPEMMTLMKQLRDIARDMHPLPHRESIAEVGVFVDEKAYALLPDSTISGPVCSLARRPLGLAGAMYDIFLATDFNAVCNRYKLCIFLMPAPTPDVLAAIEYCRTNGIPVIVSTDPGQPLTPEGLREAYRKAGIHIWCDSDDSINANEHLVVIHTATEGRKTIHLPRTRRILPLLSEEPPFTSDVIQLELRQFETRMFRLE